MAVLNPTAAKNHTVHAETYDLNIHPKLELKEIGKVSSVAMKYMATVSFNPSLIEGAPEFKAEIPLQADSQFNAIRMLHGLGEHFKKANNPAEFHKMVQKLNNSCVVMQIATTDNGYHLEFHEVNQSGTGYNRFSTDRVAVTGGQHKQMEKLLEAYKARNIGMLPLEPPKPEVLLKQITKPLATAIITVTQQEPQISHPEVLLTQIPKAAEGREDEESVASENSAASAKGTPKPTTNLDAEKRNREKEKAAELQREIIAGMAES